MPTTMISIPDHQWFCQFVDLPSGHRPIYADAIPNQLLPLVARNSTISEILNPGGRESHVDQPHSADCRRAKGEIRNQNRSRRKVVSFPGGKVGQPTSFSVRRKDNFRRGGLSVQPITYA